LTNNIFLDLLLEKHHQTQEVPTSRMVSQWAYSLLEILFPEVSEKRLTSKGELENELNKLKLDLKTLLINTKSCDPIRHDEIVFDFFEYLPQIYTYLIKDIDAAIEGDPAATCTYEIVRSYPGFMAIYIYRIAHRLHTSHVPFIPRILSEYAHSKTGIDIHPAAIIGSSFFIDHGTGVVIGETAVIGDNVKIYQGVTIGALSISKKMAGKKRHPSIEDDVVIYSGATILGGETVIGQGSIIGGNVWLTQSCPPGTKIYHNADNKIIESVWVGK
jgi:serine O-acetyltransferase